MRYVNLYRKQLFLCYSTLWLAFVCKRASVLVCV